METLIQALKNAGLTEKAARTYLAALELGECSIQDLSKQAKLKRTTLYYTLEELLDIGALVQTQRKKKVHYIAQEPDQLLKGLRTRVSALEELLPQLKNTQLSKFNKPKTYFLRGGAGFLQIWEKLFTSKEKNFSIITTGIAFTDFIKEAELLKEIIERKKQLGVHSRQLIVDSPYARKIVAKDKTELRESKFLAPGSQLPYSVIITKTFTAYISPKWEDLLVIIESTEFSKTQQLLFDLLWKNLH